MRYSPSSLGTPVSAVTDTSRRHREGILALQPSRRFQQLDDVRLGQRAEFDRRHVGGWDGPARIGPTPNPLELPGVRLRFEARGRRAPPTRVVDSSSISCFGSAKRSAR